MVATTTKRRRVAAGLCAWCEAPRRHYRQLCDPCQLRNREARRRRLGCRPWRPGGGGRPPLVAEGGE